MLIMALEAVKEMCPISRQLTGFYVKEACFASPIIIQETFESHTETILHLHPVQKPYEKESRWSDIKIFARFDQRWVECFRASIETQYEAQIDDIDGGLENKLSTKGITEGIEQAKASCTMTFDPKVFYNTCRDHGIKYGDWFQVLDGIHWDGVRETIARVDVSTSKYCTAGIVHPAVLDALFQVMMVYTSKSLESKTPKTEIPYKISDAWFASSGWQPPTTSTIHLWAPGGRTLSEQKAQRSVYALADNGMLLCAMRNIILSPVSTDMPAKTSSRQLLYGIDWKPQLSLLSSNQLYQWCRADYFPDNAATMVDYYHLLRSALSRTVHITLSQLSDENRQTVPVPLQKYVAWMEHLVQQSPVLQVSDSTSEELPDTLSRLEEMQPDWKIFPAVARNLKSILSGETNPLSLAFDSGLAEAFYKSMFRTVCDQRLRTFLELAAHENPDLRILEVGAGTGGFTQHIISDLEGLEKRAGGTRFSEYVYTDISPSFLENGRSRFGHLRDRMTFKTLDLDRSTVEQGIKEGTYDMVIAGSVLHATTNLTATVQNLRKVLKPGGHLIFFEVTSPENVITNFAFGVLPGWWLGDEPWRSLCPAITEEKWDHILRENGFSGNDIVLRDQKDNVSHLFSLIITTSQMIPSEHIPSSDVFFIVDSTSREQLALADSVREKIPRYAMHRATILPISHIHEETFKEDDVVIVLFELTTPLLMTLSYDLFQTIKFVIRSVRNLLWVSSSGISSTGCPYHGMMQGFLRSIRSESIEKKIITLSIESVESLNSWVEYIAKVFSASFTQSPFSEVEYIVRNGQIESGRLVEESTLNEGFNSLISPQLREQPWTPGPPIKLSVKSPGMLDTLQFVEVDRAQLGPHDIEIESTVWGLSFRDVFVALGRLEGEDLGYDCAGIIVRVGSAVQNDPSLQPGDRVCMISEGCMGTYARAPKNQVFKVPDRLSLEVAASIISPGITAYYSLIDVARLKRKDTILIHSAAGGTGQMAVWIAKMIGAEIFATVGSIDKKHLLMEMFGLPEDHIFYSRNTSFAQGVMRVTKGRGVDVILNSLSGDSLRASWECVAPYGRFIEIGKADITTNSALPMGGFARNITFAAVDLYHVANSDGELLGRLISDIMGLLENGHVQNPHPLNVYPVSQVEQAFRYIQSGKNSGRIIITTRPFDIVPVRISRRRSQTKFLTFPLEISPRPIHVEF